MPDETLASVEFHEVDQHRWPDFERLFESRGGPKYCWCMLFRARAAELRTAGHSYRKEAMHHRVQENVPIGLLGYLNGEPVAWCSMAPRETYQRLRGQQDAADTPGSVWSLACFFVQRRFRGKGMTRRLIQAAVDHAKAKGASVVEAYPVDPDSPSYRFMGIVRSFEAAGFLEVGRAGTRRHVMRLQV
ncbi:MAG: GNAT family N-acetyltransferase [Chloroflexi bacterium]|nr:GNAT family N-acetyltransferase [Chloroflexota bacterium]